jgi:hypothetical protein
VIVPALAASLINIIIIDTDNNSNIARQFFWRGQSRGITR